MAKVKLTNWQRNQIVSLYNQSNAPIGKLKDMIDICEKLSKAKDEKEFEFNKVQFDYTKHLLNQVQGWPINPEVLGLVDAFGVELKEKE